MHTQKSKFQRISYLDSLRGIAALMVVFYHFLGWKYPDKLIIKISNFVFNGSDAVSFFFVLSGLVLSYPYLQLNRPLDIGKFYINRIFRLYPAFWIALILVVLYVNRFGISAAPLATLFNLFISNKHGVWEEALLIRGRSGFLGLGWTLTIEIVMSFFIPFLIAAVYANRRIIIWFVFSTFILSHIFSIFLFPFVLGILISVFFEKINNDQFRETVWFRKRVLFLIFGIILFSIRHIDKIFPFGEKYHSITSFLNLDFFTFTAIGSFIFLVYTIHFRSVQKFLMHPILLYFGKISYGIYLVHWLIVMAIFDYWDRIIVFFPNIETSFITMLILCLTTTIILATAIYYWVELPLIKRGKHFTEKIKPTLVISDKAQI